MGKLASVDSPEPVALSLPERAAPPRALGSTGTASQETSRSVRAYVVSSRAESPPTALAGGQLALETVMGADDRQRILDTDLLPWRFICALRIQGADSAAIGTGWLAGPQTVITAGHCVRHRDLGGDGWAQRIEVTPGRNRNDAPFGRVGAVRFSTHRRWAEDADADYDIGCIHLDESLGDRVGWFGYAAVEPADLEHHLVNISGYPADRGAGQEQYFHANRIMRVTTRRLFYEVDTYGGQSGSPVWIQATAEEPPRAVAVHAYGISTGITANSAPRIDNEVYDLIQHWTSRGHVLVA